jgi:D-lactate dehydrogenase (cytochrome)
LIDLFIGSEGTLGVITEAELKLIPKPEKEFNLMFFLSSESTAVELTEALRNEPNVEITAIEYFDPGALALLRERRKRMGAASTVPPGLPDDKAVAALVIDIAADSPNSCLEAMETLKEIAKKLKSGESILEWAAFDRDERERLRLFRHALPETVNSLIGERRRMYPKITKLGTDMAVPDEYLQDILKIYRQELDKNSLDYVIFGHIGNNHVHVNILPKTPEEYDLGKKLYGGFAEKVLAMHGSISAEHGIGKLKTAFLAMMLKPKGIEQMRALKKLFDPNFLLGAGTLFE